jgi:hypothetical protein
MRKLSTESGPAREILRRQETTVMGYASHLVTVGEIERQIDPLSFRVFRLYLAGSAYEFRCGRLNIYQTLLAKPVRGQSGLPLTRADWYKSSRDAAPLTRSSGSTSKVLHLVPRLQRRR